MSLAASLALAACGGGSDSSPESSASDAPPSGVTISQSRFGPTELVVAAGSSVTFENTDPFAHTVTAADGSAVSFVSGDLGEADTFTVEFSEPGTYAYFCEIHPTMRATVVVE